MNTLPSAYEVDPDSYFQPGMIGQLYIKDNKIVCGVSNGISPLGVIDDIKTNSSHKTSENELVITGPVPAVPGRMGGLVSAIDYKTELKNINIIASSFSSDISCQLLAYHGVIKFLAGTPLNFDANGDGIPDSIKTTVDYKYAINQQGTDSTTDTGRITIWRDHFVGETDQFDEKTGTYEKNCPLFVNNGQFTTIRNNEIFPPVAVCVNTQLTINKLLQFRWL